MGNHVSSRSSRVEISSCNNKITVVLDVAGPGDQGRVIEVKVEASSSSAISSMKVGELLLEFSPGHFLAHFPRSSFDTATATSSASRLPASPLGADSDAMAGAAHVYVLLPMLRLHTRLSAHERLIIAGLLHNHAAAACLSQVVLQQQELTQNKLTNRKSAPTLIMGRLLKHASSKLQVSSLMWGRCGGAVRVAPHDDQQEISSFKATSELKMAINMADQVLLTNRDDKDQKPQLGQQYTQVFTMPKLVPTTVLKAKPWAPKLETVSE